MAIANLAMLTGNIGREGVGVNPLRGQNNVQGSCDMGSFPHELPGYRHISDQATRELFESAWGVTLDSDPGLRIPNMFDAALGGTFKGLYCQGEDIAQSDPNTQHVEAALRAIDCLVVQDIFLNEYEKNEPFQKAILSDIETIFARRGVDIGHILPKELTHCRNFILEELAVDSLFFQKYEVAWIYPGKALEAYTYLRTKENKDFAESFKNHYPVRLMSRDVAISDFQTVRKAA